MADPIDWYDANAETVVAQYEGLAADTVHGWLRDLLPKGSATVLDIGAGSGRDAAWLSAKGYDVVAVEPSASMRTAGATKHALAPIRWIDDRLPALATVSKSGLSFDLILLSAVWMHLPTGDRPRAFRKIINLLKPGGLLAIVLRDGPADQARGIHPVSLEEIEGLARDHGAFVERHTEAEDHLGRPGIRWIQVAIRLPDDGTGALPLLRHVILNDDKSSTYKLALLRRSAGWQTVQQDVPAITTTSSSPCHLEWSLSRGFGCSNLCCPQIFRKTLRISACGASGS